MFSWRLQTTNDVFTPDDLQSSGLPQFLDTWSLWSSIGSALFPLPSNHDLFVFMFTVMRSRATGRSRDTRAAEMARQKDEIRYNACANFYSIAFVCVPPVTMPTARRPITFLSLVGRATVRTISHFQPSPLWFPSTPLSTDRVLCNSYDRSRGLLSRSGSNYGSCFQSG